MSRQLRLEYPGSLWHITSRGNEKKPIFRDDNDRVRFLELLAETVRVFRWIVTAYVLMDNHFHLLVQLTEATLSRGMHWLNGEYPKWFNWRHDRVGHLYQGRFKGKLIEKEAYFLEVQRYVVLNPVRAHIVERPEEYPWSSYRALIGTEPSPPWLSADDVLIHFGEDVETARAQYRSFVNAGIGAPSPWEHLVSDMFLGSDEWIETVRDRVKLKPRASEYRFDQREVAHPTMTDVVSAVAEVMGVAQDQIRGGHGGTPRQVAAWIGRFEGMLTNAEIAAGLLVRSEGHVTNMIRNFDRELSSSSRLRDCVDRCISTIGRKKQRAKV